MYLSMSATPNPLRRKVGRQTLPADFVAEAITTLGTQVTDGFRSFDVENPHDDGCPG
jgi:fatty acid CoA ligase FadD9